MRKACFVLVGAALGWSVAASDVRMHDGGAPFGLAMSFKTSARGQDGSLILRFSGKYPKGSPAHAVLRLPQELELVEGQLSRAFDAWAGDSWTVSVPSQSTAETSLTKGNTAFQFLWRGLRAASNLQRRSGLKEYARGSGSGLVGRSLCRSTLRST